MPSDETDVIGELRLDFFEGKATRSNCGKTFALYHRLRNPSVRQQFARVWVSNMANIERHLRSCLHRMRRGASC